MPTRRNFLGATAALAALAALPASGLERSRLVNRAEVLRRTDENGWLISMESWRAVEFRELKKGDVFRLFEPAGTPVSNDEALVCRTDAYRRRTGSWAVEADLFPITPGVNYIRERSA